MGWATVVGGGLVRACIPEPGALPNAYSGEHAFWFGNSASNNFLPDDGTCEPGDGGTGGPVGGSLVSPSVGVQGYTSLYLSFYSAFEIESQDPQAPPYGFDWMLVEVQVDGAGAWETVGCLNPDIDADGLSYQPYSSSGFDSAPVWVNHTYDLSQWAGATTLQVRFRYESAGTNYRGSAAGWWTMWKSSVSARAEELLSGNHQLKIGNVVSGSPFVLAPMDGYTDLPFRRVCRRRGADLCYTEMIPVMSLIHGARSARRHLRLEKGEGPVAAQIAGHDPVIMANAARVLQDHGVDMVDVNAGCPSRRVTNGGAGAALLSDLDRLGRILESVRSAIQVPLTLKVRSGPTADRIVLDEVALLAKDTGVDAVTVHPRTRAQRFGGRADWSLIARFKSRFPSTVIGNGDVVTAHDGLRMLDETGCDGVMVGRGAVGNPWLFGEMAAALRGDPAPPRPSRAERFRTILEHFDAVLEFLDGDELVTSRVFRKHLAKYVRGLPGAVQVRRCMCQVVSRKDLVRVVSQVFVEED